MKSLYEMMAFTVSTALSSSLSLFYFISLQKKKFIQSMVIKKINFQLAKPIVQYFTWTMRWWEISLHYVSFTFFLFSSFNGELLWESTFFSAVHFQFFQYFFIISFLLYFSYGLRSLLVLWLLYTLLNYSFTFIFNANFSKRILSKKVGALSIV